MPFTLVHPAAVLPLVHGPLSLLALVCGAIAPDLPSFLRATPLQVTAESWYEPYLNATTSHSLTGLLWVSLPLALIFYVCARLMLSPMRWVAGQGARTADERSLLGILANGVWVVVALGIGMLTHVAWDALTEVGQEDSRFLQHASTALGALVLVWVAWRRRSVVNWQENAVRRRLLTGSSTCVLVAAIGAAITSSSWFPLPSELSTGQVVEGIITAATIGAISGLVVATALLTLAWWVARLTGKLHHPARSR